MSDKKTELLELINATNQWHAPGEFSQTLSISGVATNVNLRALAGEGLIQCVKPPKGFGTGIKKIYGKLGIEPPAAAQPDKPVATRRPKKARKPKKMRGLVVDARARRAKHKVKRRGKYNLKTRVALTPVGRDLIKAAPLTPRWALTSDGAFINLADNLELGKTETRALVDFVRTLDAGAA